MFTDHDIQEAAKSPISASELQTLIKNELDDEGHATDDLRLLIAADMLCDAAMEVMASATATPSITKVVLLGSSTLELREMAITHALTQAHQTGGITHEQLQTLLIRSATANVIANALNDGQDPKDFAEATLKLTPLRLSALCKKQTPSNGLFSRLFGQR